LLGLPTAEIHRLREAVKGPDGYASWQDAATDERIRRVRAEAALAAQPEGSVVVTYDRGQIVAVTRQDDEGRVLEVIGEAAQEAQEAKP
jgi:hypothetical protein